QHYGDIPRSATSQLGGAYDHHAKELVAIDLGSTLRHEFFHVIHARDQERLGQRHATWILEGLASLLEDFDPIDTSPPSLTPAESRRSNIVRRMARINRIPPVEALAGLEAERFTRQRALAKYAQAHAVCLYLDRQGLLDDFYRLYTTDPADGYDADPTGLAALRAVLRTDDDGIDERLRLWARDELPEVPEEWTDADATIPVRVETDDDKGGVRVIQRRPPAGVNLRLGDVIVAMDGKPTPDFAEMLRHLIRAEPGQVVTLDIVRGKLTRQESVELIPTP
ncbi:MAG: PDZ domain-containing protein, partial [Planctomycetota bacterium]